MISFVMLFLPFLVMTFLVYVCIHVYIYIYIGKYVYFFGIIPVYSCWYFIYAVCYVCAGVPESWQSFPVKHAACHCWFVAGSNECGFLDASSFDF